VNKINPDCNNPHSLKKVIGVMNPKKVGHLFGDETTVPIINAL
jgi:hypothetical protein